jgi:hypothetical protein
LNQLSIEQQKQTRHVEAGRARPVAIWPSAPSLPSNVLRFYVEFDAPAEASFDRRELRLLDQLGREIPEPFLVLGHELWSLDGQRLTVLFDPARIKRRLGDGPGHSPAIHPGQSYSLTVRGADGALSSPFLATAGVYTALDEALWSLDIPRTASFDPLVIRFDRVMDAALCSEEITVLGPHGDLIEGCIGLSNDGSVASFSPSSEWLSGNYCLEFSKRLEDVCGNRIGEPLDHLVSEQSGPRTAAMPFVV